MGFIDLTGQKFNRLTVIERIPNTSPIMWKCKCDCGNIIEVRGSYLRNGHTKSCGCQRAIIAKQTGKKNLEDLTGQKFGFLTAIKDTGKRYKKNNGAIWLCKCDCGNFTEVLATNLKSGSTKSCGCVKKSFGEAKIELILKENNFSYITEFCVPELNNARFDFAIMKGSIITKIIEFDGEHHYEPISFHKNNKYNLEERQKRDRKKNEWALKNNIPLVRIPYWERDNITLDMIMSDQYLVK